MKPELNQSLPIPTKNTMEIASDRSNGASVPTNEHLKQESSSNSEKFDLESNLEFLNDVIKEWEDAQAKHEENGIHDLIKKVEGKIEAEKENRASKLKKPNDLYQRILNNIEKYNYLCDEEFAGPITKKEILAHLTEQRSNAEVHLKVTSSRPRAPLTVPMAPKFKTEERLSLKEKSQLQSSEELELEEIRRMREVVEMQRKMNEEKVKEIEKYSKPFLKKKETTTFQEFRLSTEARSEKHSEFRKQNKEKLEEKRELEKAKNEQKKMEEKLKCQKILKHYNHSRGISEQSMDETRQEFISLRSQLEKALTRKEQQDLLVNSPAEKIKPRRLTTPHSPSLSVKKR